MTPAPCDTRAVLEVNFDIDVCQTVLYNHLKDENVKSSPMTVSCARLNHAFPFVKRTEVTSQKGGVVVGGRSGYQMETLMLGNRKLSRQLLQSHC